MTRLRLGAHMSIAGGPAKALLRGRSIGCDAIQMFTRNANRWSSRDLTPKEISDFEEARIETKIDPIVAHSSYLINLATPDETLGAKSLRALITEMKRCKQLGIDSYVLHPGAHVGSGEEAGLARVAEALNVAFEATPDSNVVILLETTAGQGTGLGYKYEQLAWLIEHVEVTRRVGVCFDTAHALAAGYEFRQKESYEAMWQQFDAIIGLERLRAIHLNDSKRDLGSRVDRHEHIGQGFVGLEAFRLLVNDPALCHVPMLLETPKGPEMLEDVKNLVLLRSLIDSKREHCQTKGRSQRGTS